MDFQLSFLYQIHLSKENMYAFKICIFIFRALLFFPLLYFMFDFHFLVVRLIQGTKQNVHLLNFVIDIV